MTVDALLNILLAVVVPGLMALIGGILAAKALPTEPGEKKTRAWAYIAAFGLLFLVSVVLAFVQQIRSTEHDRVAEAKAANAELKSTGEIKYMQGQLDNQSKMLAMIVSNSDPKQLAVLLKGMSPGDHSTLKKRTIGLCSDLEAWDKRYPRPPAPAIPGKPTQKELDDQNAFAGKWMSDYSEKFGVRVLGVLQEYGAKGFPVTMMERQAEYGAMPNGVCLQLRAFAGRLNEDGTVKQ